MSDGSLRRRSGDRLDARRGPARPALALLALLATAGCGGGEELTADAIARARTTWERADLRDYDLEWTSSGEMSGHYRVAVRGGTVRRIDSVLPDGREVEARPARPDFYGVDGLFLTLEDELAQLRTATPFGRPKGTTAVLRFTPDPDLGYTRYYRRDVMGAPRGLAIDVIRLDPVPPPDPRSDTPATHRPQDKKEHRRVGSRREGPGLPVGAARGEV